MMKNQEMNIMEHIIMDGYLRTNLQAIRYITLFCAKTLKYTYEEKECGYTNDNN
jgi:hypothetical protein